MDLGYHFTDDSFVDTVPAALYLDQTEWGTPRGEISGGRSGRQLVRPYANGRPRVQDFANKSRSWAYRRTPWGFDIPVQALNEPNLSHEQFGGGPDEYADWFWRLTDECPEVDFYYAPMSPDGNWLPWYTFGLPKRAIVQRAKGLVVHAYGDYYEIKQVMDQIIGLNFKRPIWVGEFNWGAGRTIDANWWAETQLPLILNYFNEQPQIEAATYFAWTWDRPDGGLDKGTPVDARKHESIQREIRRWTT